MSKKQNQIDTQQYISSIDRYWDILGAIVNNDDLGDEEKELMLTRDETIKAGLKYTTNHIFSSIGRFTHPDKNIDEVISQALDFSDTSLANVIHQMIYDAQGYGFSVGEVVYTIENGYAKVADIIRLVPYRCLFREETNGGLSVEYTTSKLRKIILAPEKTLVLRNGGGIYGESMLRSIFSSWQLKTALRKWWAIAMEKFAVPTVVAESADPNAARAIFAAWFSKAGVSVPIGDKVTTLHPGSDMAKSFKNSIEYLNTLIFRGLQVPQLISAVSESGAYATSRTHMQLFQDTMKAQAKYFSNQILDQLITRLIEYNFGVQTDYGAFAVATQASADDIATLSNTIATLVQSGVVDPTEPWVRDMLAIPKYEGDIDAERNTRQDGFIEREE